VVRDPGLHAVTEGLDHRAICVTDGGGVDGLSQGLHHGEGERRMRSNKLGDDVVGVGSMTLCWIPPISLLPPLLFLLFLFFDFIKNRFYWDCNILLLVTTESRALRVFAEALGIALCDVVEMGLQQGRCLVDTLERGQVHVEHLDNLRHGVVVSGRAVDALVKLL